MQEIEAIDIANSRVNSPYKLVIENSNEQPVFLQQTINYSVKESGYIKMNAYDISGKLVDTIIDSYQVSGSHSVVWSPVNLSSGMYYVNLTQGINTDQMKVMYVK